MSAKSSLILPAAGVLLLAGCVSVTYSPGPSSPSPSDASPAASPSAASASPAESFTPGAPDGQCLTANLSVTVQDEGASAGHLHSKIVFTNNGPDCALQGYPNIQVMNAGVPMGSSSEEDSSASAALVTIAAGGSAVAQLTSVNIDPGGGPLGESCAVDHGSGYLVTPPHSYSPISVDVAGVPACTNGTVWMVAGPVTAP